MSLRVMDSGWEVGAAVYHFLQLDIRHTYAYAHKKSLPDIKYEPN